MQYQLNSFRDHTPPDILHENQEVKKFLDIFDGMLNTRREELDNFVRRFYYPAVSDIRLMRRFVDEWDAEYLDTSSKLCIDCLYRNYHYIYSSKGTARGIKRLLECLFYDDVRPIVTLDSFEGGKPLILSDDSIFVDHLPNGEDLADEVDADPGEELWVPTLLGGTWLHHYTKVTITVGVNYVPTPEFLEFIKSVLTLYLPMVNPDILSITINTYLI